MIAYIFLYLFQAQNLTEAALVGTLAEFVVLDQQPFNVLGARSLGNLVRVAANDLALPSRPTVARRVGSMAVNAEKKIRKFWRGNARP